MNEKLQYAEMLDMPIETSTITYKRIKSRKRKKKKDEDSIKKELIDKINENNGEAPASENPATIINQSESSENTEETSSVKPVKKKKMGFKISVIGVQVAVLCALVATIFLTNALLPESGINSFIKGVFSGRQNIVDTRAYTDFSPVIKNGVIDSEGKINLTAKKSAYSPCEGKVESVTLAEDKTYSVEIKHSQNFKTVFKGLKHIYVNTGDSVVSTVPIGFVESEGATMCFLGGDGAAIVNFTLDGSAVVWAV